MRAAADGRLSGTPGYRSVDGGAEGMPLEAGSVDLITAAQAFHWFDPAGTRAEFGRVLKPDGTVALIWNDRLPDDPLHAALDGVFQEYGGEKRASLAVHEERLQVAPFFGDRPPEHLSWGHDHLLDSEGLASLVFSRSYMPLRGTAEGGQAERAIGEIFARFADGGQVRVGYRTHLFFGTLG
jgi:SAM-dependent methyltransferase